MIAPYKVTAIKLKKKVEVHNQLNSGSDQSLDIASLRGLRIKYAVINKKTKQNDNKVARISFGFT